MLKAQVTLVMLSSSNLYALGVIQFSNLFATPSHTICLHLIIEKTYSWLRFQ